MANPRSLSAIQQQFADALLFPDQSTRPLFKSSPEQAQERLGIYRGNVSAIWTQALQNTYPVLYQLVGAEFFEQMAKAYGRAHPSTSGDLNEFGSQLAIFLADPITGIGIINDYPYFPDVANLEWHVHTAYYAANTAPLGLAEVIEKTGEHFGQTRLRLHPACRLITSEWACATIWQAHQPNTDVAYPEQLEVKNYCLVNRQHWSVEVHALGIASYLGLLALSQGKSIGSALEQAMEHDPDFQIADQLQQWFNWGIFVESKLSSSDERM